MDSDWLTEVHAEKNETELELSFGTFLSHRLAMDPVKKLKLVYGYIKIEISFLEAPSDINHIIDLIDRFLTFSDKWDVSYVSKGIKIDEKHNTITKA